MNSSTVERCLAVIPAFNESATVSGVVSDMREHAPEFDVLVVDDGSTDDTAARARAAGAAVVQLPFNLGIGGAVQSGYRYAQANGYGLVVQVDGDGQHPPEQIRRLVDAYRAHPEVHFVYGSRFQVKGQYDSPLNRRIGIAIFARLLSVITRQRVTDPTSGFRLAGPRGIDLFARDYPHDYPEVEAILMVHAHRMKIIEVPVTMHQRGGGSSSITWLHSGYYMIKVMLAVIIGLFRARPAVLPGEPAPVSAQHQL